MQIVLEPFDSLAAYDEWLDQQPDDEYYEVVEGIPVMSPSPSGSHQLALSRLFGLLLDAVRQDCVVMPAPWDWLLQEEPRLGIRQPDLVVIRRSQVERRLLDTPILAVEVLSPSTIERDALTKREEYAAAGLEHYWLVNPTTPGVVVFRRQRGVLVPVDAAARDEELRIDEPFTLTIRPADLIA